MIKKCWVHEYEDDMFVIAMRQAPGASHAIEAAVHKFPPVEEIDGKKLNINEAKERGLDEFHTALRFLSRNDLITLRKAIDEVLYA